MWPTATRHTAPVRYADFRQVAALPVTELRRIVDAHAPEHGSAEPVERVWAVWALALASGAGATAQLGASVTTEPAPGVRRHLAIVLAGLGDRATLTALAELDPAPGVRASACRCLARIAPAHDAHAWTLLVRSLAPGNDLEVRLAVLDGIGGTAPGSAWDACRAVLSDPNVEIRGAAVDAVALRCGGAAAARYPRFPPELRAAMFAEPNGGLRARLFEYWVEAEGGDAVATALATAPASLVVEALDVAVARAATPTWDALAPLAQRNDADIDERLIGLATVPLSWLFELLLRFHRLPEGSPAWDDGWPPADACVAKLKVMLPALDAGARIGAERRLAAELADVVERKVAEWQAEYERYRNSPEFDDLYGDFAPQVLGEELVPELRRLAGR